MANKSDNSKILEGVMLAQEQKSPDLQRKQRSLLDLLRARPSSAPRVDSTLFAPTETAPGA